MQKNILVGTFLSGLVLFFWSGLTQVLPWGVPSTNVLSSQTTGQTELFQAPNAEYLPPNELTTAKFDTTLVNQVTTLATDGTFSWIVTKPLSYYSPTNYFLRELFTQFLVGLFLTVIAILTKPLPLKQRLSIILAVGLAAAVGTYGQLFNWWGLTGIYAFGVSLNLVLGWLAAGFVLTKFVIKRDALQDTDHNA